MIDCWRSLWRLSGSKDNGRDGLMAASKSHLPIIFISAHADDDPRTRALEAGAVAFLYKPFYEEELLNAIDLALKGS
jgi:FixJ family two-component response regulator